jgi:hypothetical protein
MPPVQAPSCCRWRADRGHTRSVVKTERASRKLIYCSAYCRERLALFLGLPSARLNLPPVLGTRQMYTLALPPHRSRRGQFIAKSRGASLVKIEHPDGEMPRTLRWRSLGIRRVVRSAVFAANEETVNLALVGMEQDRFAMTASVIY